MAFEVEKLRNMVPEVRDDDFTNILQVLSKSKISLVIDLALLDDVDLNMIFGDSPGTVAHVKAIRSVAATFKEGWLASQPSQFSPLLQAKPKYAMAPRPPCPILHRPAH